MRKDVPLRNMAANVLRSVVKPAAVSAASTSERSRGREQGESEDCEETHGVVKGVTSRRGRVGVVSFVGWIDERKETPVGWGEKTSGARQRGRLSEGTPR